MDKKDNILWITYNNKSLLAEILRGRVEEGGGGSRAAPPGAPSQYVCLNGNVEERGEEREGRDGHQPQCVCVCVCV